MPSKSRLARQRPAQDMMVTQDAMPAAYPGAQGVETTKIPQVDSKAFSATGKKRRRNEDDEAYADSKEGSPKRQQLIDVSRGSRRTIKAPDRYGWSKESPDIIPSFAAGDTRGDTRTHTPTPHPHKTRDLALVSQSATIINEHSEKIHVPLEVESIQTIKDKFFHRDQSTQVVASDGLAAPMVTTATLELRLNTMKAEYETKLGDLRAHGRKKTEELKEVRRELATKSAALAFAQDEIAREYATHQTAMKRAIDKKEAEQKAAIENVFRDLSAIMHVEDDRHEHAEKLLKERTTKAERKASHMMMLLDQAKSDCDKATERARTLRFAAQAARNAFAEKERGINARMAEIDAREDRLAQQERELHYRLLQNALATRQSMAAMTADWSFIGPVVEAAATAPTLHRTLAACGPVDSQCDVQIQNSNIASAEESVTKWSTAPSSPLTARDQTSQETTEATIVVGSTIGGEPAMGAEMGCMVRDAVIMQGDSK